MTDALRKYLTEKAPDLDKKDLEFYLSLFAPKKLAKGEFLLHEGDVSKHIAFVVKGCLRQYTIDNKGKEHIVQFAPENWWISDIESFNKRTPAICNIDA